MLFGHVGGQTRRTHKRLGRDHMALGGALALGAFVQAVPRLISGRRGTCGSMEAGDRGTLASSQQGHFLPGFVTHF